MTGMEIAQKIQLREEIIEAVYRTQSLTIELDPGDFWKNIEKIEVFAQEDNGLRVLRFYLDWAVELKQHYDALGIPEQVFWDGLKDMVIWTEDYWKKHGVPGLAEWGWVATTLSMRVFRLGRLQFEPSHLEEDLGGYPAGTPMLGVHIPAGEPLDVASVREAMEYAPQFFENYFGKTFMLFHCHSWLLSPQLKELLAVDSRIIQFQDLFTVLAVDSERQAEERVFGFLAEDPAAYPEETSLQRKMKNSLMAGKHYGMGCGIRVIPQR